MVAAHGTDLTHPGMSLTVPQALKTPTIKQTLGYQDSLQRQSSAGIGLALAPQCQGLQGRQRAVTSQKAGGGQCGPRTCFLNLFPGAAGLLVPEAAAARKALIDRGGGGGRALRAGPLQHLDQ